MSTNITGKLEGKVALVTGGSRGIGAAIAKRLGADGAAVALTYSASPGKADEVVRSIEAAGGKALAILADAADTAAVRRAVAKTIERFGGIDILVNNAALMAEVTPLGGLTTIPLDVWHRTIAVNLTGPLLCVRAVLPYLKEKGYGKIVNQSSGGAFMPSHHYGVSKLGLVSMTISLAHELAPFGIRVNAIAPGSVLTDAGHRAGSDEYRAWIQATVPFPTAPPEDLVGGLIYLTSAASDWVTGHTLNIDGGWISRT